MKKKPFIQVLLSVLLVAVILVGGTLAYMVASDNPVLNRFTFAKVQTNIDEDPKFGKEEDKKPYVENTGSSPVYVRAKAVVVTQEDSPVAVSQDQVEIKYTNQWTLADDGYYYYNAILQPAKEGEVSQTELLFNGVDVSDTVPKDAKFSIVVYHESVLAPGTSPEDVVAAAKAAFAAAEQNEAVGS